MKISWYMEWGNECLKISWYMKGGPQGCDNMVLFSASYPDGFTL